MATGKKALKLSIPSQNKRDLFMVGDRASEVLTTNLLISKTILESLGLETNINSVMEVYALLLSLEQNIRILENPELLEEAKTECCSNTGCGCNNEGTLTIEN